MDERSLERGVKSSRAKNVGVAYARAEKKHMCFTWPYMQLLADNGLARQLLASSDLKMTDFNEGWDEFEVADFLQRTHRTSFLVKK